MVRVSDAQRLARYEEQMRELAAKAGEIRVAKVAKA
jgi:hypothetical protein